MTRIAMEVEGIRLEGELDDTPPARALAERLPLELDLDRWGDEYYGDLGGALGDFCGATVELMAVGDLAYWAPGNALCIIFGPTPASRGPQPQAASPVFQIGLVQGDWLRVKALGATVRARVSRALEG